MDGIVDSVLSSYGRSISGEAREKLLGYIQLLASTGQKDEQLVAFGSAYLHELSAAAIWYDHSLAALRIQTGQKGGQSLPNADCGVGRLLHLFNEQRSRAVPTTARGTDDSTHHAV
jgi:hypothetical protein